MKRLLETTDMQLRLFVEAVVDIGSVDQIGVGTRGVGDEFIVNVFHQSSIDTQPSSPDFKLVTARCGVFVV